MLRALTRKFRLADDVDLVHVASRTPHSVSGADLYALCAGALLSAIRERAAQEDAAGAGAAAARADESGTSTRQAEVPLVCARHFEAAVARAPVDEQAGAETPNGITIGGCAAAAAAAPGTPVPAGYSRSA